MDGWNSSKSQSSIGAAHCMGEGWTYVVYLVFGLVFIVSGLSMYGVVFSRISFDHPGALKAGGVFLGNILR